MADDYPRDALKPGQLLLWYRIERILGEGGFGMTYLAHDVNLDKHVAIKEYLPGDMCHRKDDNTIAPFTSAIGEFETGLNRFIREARTLAKFEHPNIVKVSNVFEENHTAYMAMTYEKGKDLKDLLSPRKVIKEDHILSIILPILEGLEYVHSTGYIHRDIKPGNIIIREDGSPVLIDFGSVHDTKKSKAAVTTLVSPGFTPHEQYVGKPELQGPWTDIYSLGATLYRCVCGINPMDAISRGSSIIKQDGDPLQSTLETGQGRYNEHLLKAIDHALAFNEKERPQTVAEWKEELIGQRLVEKGDTLDESNYINPSITSNDNSDRTVNLTQQASTQPKKQYQTLILACIAILIVSIGITFFNNNENTEQVIEQNTATTQDTVIETTPMTSKKEAIEETIDVLEGEITDKLTDGSTAPTLVIIPKGSNIVGSEENENGRRNDEGPQSLITIKDAIAIGKTEITVGQFKQFVSASNYVTEAESDSSRGCRTYQSTGWGWTPGTSWKNPGYEQDDTHPVVCVSWMDAMAYVKWLSIETGNTYQLPSEAIWEYASRAGTTTTRFWGDERACEYSNVSDFSRAAMHGLDISSKNIFACEDGSAYSAEVASFKPNQFGLYDTIGNVWEWTVDCWNNSYNNINNDGTPRLDGNCNNRVYRGGSWGNLPNLVRAAKRLTDPSYYRYYNLGFRISRIVRS